MPREVYVGMSRKTMEELRGALDRALFDTPEGGFVQIELDGAKDPEGVVLTINNDDIDYPEHRDDLPEGVIYASANQ